MQKSCDSNALPMPENFRLCRETALAIAGAIVFDRCPWSLARDRVFAGARTRVRVSSEQIESAVRETWATFAPEEHARLLAKKRQAALLALSHLQGYEAYLCGAVLNGSAGIDSTIRIEVFADDTKEIEFFLLDQGILVEALDTEPGPMPEPLASLGFLLAPKVGQPPEGVRLEVFSHHLVSRNPRKRAPDPWQEPWEASGRIDAQTLQKHLHVS